MNQHTQSKKSFSCENCGRRFRWPSDLARHELTCHRRTLRTGKKSCVCGVCGKNFRFPSDLARHELACRRRTLRTDKSTQSRKSYVCEKCGGNFQSITKLAHHKRSRCGKKVKTDQNSPSNTSYICGLCGKNFRWPSDLARHELTCRRRTLRTGKKSYVCGLCGKNFRWPSDLARHELACRRRTLRTDKSTQSRKSYICEKCGGNFQSITKLAHHKRSRCGKKVKTDQNSPSNTSYICGLCGKNFRWPSELARHELTCRRRTLRTGKKSYVCGLCGKNFRWPSDLTQHANTHSGKALTEQSTASKELEGEGCDSLTQHTLSHPRGKQQIEAPGHNSQTTEQSISIHTSFLCDQWGQGFPWFSDLTQHLFTHSGEPLYHCDISHLQMIENNESQQENNKEEEEGQSNCGEAVPVENIPGEYLQHLFPLGSREPCKPFACQKACECGESHFTSHSAPEMLPSIIVWEIGVNGLPHPLFQMQPSESGYCGTNDDNVNPQPTELSPSHVDIKSSTELTPILSSHEAIAVERTVPSTSGGLQRKAFTEGIASSIEQPQAVANQHPKVPRFLSTPSLLKEGASSPVGGDKPYACPKCPKQFSSTSYLSKHLPIHQARKPYKCSTCGKVFAQRSYLAKHQELHTVSLEHECPICGSFFTRSSYLKKHICRHRRSGQPKS